MNSHRPTFIFAQYALGLAVTLTASSAGAFPLPAIDQGDWPWWRGPQRNGVAVAGQDVPTVWSDTQNVKWKVPLPGRGHSSPTVVGERIYLATADERAQTQHVLALNRGTGKQIWKTQISRGGFPKTHPKNTHATCTVASDGKHLFVTFHHHNVLTLAALDLDGNVAWKKEAGPYYPKVYEYGYAPSPVLWDSLVIIAADYEKGGYIAAFHRNTGKEEWRTNRPKSLSFSSPVIATISGRDQLLISGCQAVASYDPKTGRGLWSTPGTTMATCGTMVWDGDLVFASGGYPKPETICVKADGSKQVVWKNREKCYEQSMVIHKGYVYALTDRGIAVCWRGSDGKEMWKERLQGPVSASPVLVGDTIYQSVENGTTFVYKADPSGFRLISKNKLGTEAFATLSICGNQIFARVADRGTGRRQEYLYCLTK